MMKISKYLPCVALALALFSCSKDEPIKKPEAPQNKHLVMEASGSIAAFDLVDYDLAANGGDKFRAHLTSKGYGKGPHITFKTTDFGSRMAGHGLANPNVVEPRWGVIGFGEWTIANNAVEGIEDDPTNRPAGLGQQTVVVEQMPYGMTKIHMYWWQANGNYKSFRPGSYGYMSISGVSGYGTYQEWYRQNFNNGYNETIPGIPDPRYGITSNYPNYGIDPNEKLVAVNNGEIESGRHIPVMTDLIQIYSDDWPVGNEQVASNDGTKMAARVNWNFQPRGSLFALRLKNVVGEDITVKAIKVQNESPLWFAGYYDWGWARDREDPYFNHPNNRKVLPLRFVGQVLMRGGGDVDAVTPKFPGEYNVYPLCKNDVAKTQGVEIAANASDDSLPLFYLWGHQMDNKIGDPLKLKIVYTTASEPNVDKESLLMSIAPPKEQREVTFVEGVEYIRRENPKATRQGAVATMLKEGTTPVVRTEMRGGFHSGVAYSVTVKVQKQTSDWETPAEYDYPDLGGYTY